METKLNTLPNFSIYIDACALEMHIIHTQSLSPTLKFMMFFSFSKRMYSKQILNKTVLIPIKQQLNIPAIHSYLQVMFLLLLTTTGVSSVLFPKFPSYSWTMQNTPMCAHSVLCFYMSSVVN